MNLSNAWGTTEQKKAGNEDLPSTFLATKIQKIKITVIVNGRLASLLEAPASE